jgi:hypothetical protein
MSAQPADPYIRPYARPTVAPAAPATGTRPVSLLARVLLTLIGAAGMIIGGFMNWTQGMNGVDLSYRAFYQTTFVHDTNFVTTVGFAMIALGLLALIGLAPRSGWLTRLAGALGIVGVVLFVIQLARSNAAMPESIDLGAWIALAGSVVALIGGFFGTRTMVVAGPGTAVATTE